MVGAFLGSVFDMQKTIPSMKSNSQSISNMIISLKNSSTPQQANCHAVNIMIILTWYTHVKGQTFLEPAVLTLDSALLCDFTVLCLETCIFNFLLPWSSHEEFLKKSISFLIITIFFDKRMIIKWTSGINRNFQTLYSFLMKLLLEIIKFKVSWGLKLTGNCLIFKWSTSNWN